MLRSITGILGAVALAAWGTTAARGTGSPGVLDSTYGSGGVAAASAADGLPEDGDLQADGKMVTSGWIYEGGVQKWVVRRFTAAGALDTTFGTSGVVRLFGGSGADRAECVRVAPDGRLFVAGQRTRTEGTGRRQKTITSGAVACLTSSGDLDNSFGNGGVVDTGTPWIKTLAFLDAGGGSYDVLLGTFVTVTVSSGGGKKGGTTTSSYAATLLRYDDTGAPVTSFGTNGVLRDDVSTVHNEYARLVRVDSANRIVLLVSQYSVATGAATDVLLCRYSAAGVLDTTFGTNGRMSIGATRTVTDLVLDASDRPVVASYSAGEPSVIRYEADGSGVDLVFDAPALPDSGTGEVDTYSGALAIDASGRVHAVLWYGVANWDVTVARFTSTGALDAAFGPSADGLAEVPDLSNQDQPGPLAIDGSGRILMAGSLDGPAVARWLGD